MAEINDTNAEAAPPSASAGGTASALTATGESEDTAPVPVYESLIYEFADPGLGGGGLGRPGTIGGLIGDKPPKYRVLTYRFSPPQVPDIEGS